MVKNGLLMYGCLKKYCFHHTVDISVSFLLQMPANVPVDKVLLEKTPNYFGIPRSIYFLSQMNASVILVLRHPVRRALSDLAMKDRLGVPQKMLKRFIFDVSGEVNIASVIILIGLDHL